VPSTVVVMIIGGWFGGLSVAAVGCMAVALLLAARLNRRKVKVMGEVFKLDGSGKAKRVLFDGSHVGSSKSEPSSQIEVSLGESFPNKTPGFGPGAPAHRKSGDRSIPGRVESQDG